MWKLDKLLILVIHYLYRLSGKKSVFIDPEDDVSKAWIEAIIRGRLSEFTENSIFCLGPPTGDKKEINGNEVCGNLFSVKTHVHNELVAFCDDHIVILHNYLKKKSNHTTYDNN